MSLHENPTGKTVEWYTPPELFRALALEFDLDPCAPPLPAASWIPALNRISLPKDGLAEPWFGRVWLNPPYGTGVGRWVQKLAYHGDGIALVFARSDSAWWQRCAELADALCFVAGRVKFRAGSLGPHRSGAAPAASCLMAFGTDCAQALHESALGVTAAPKPPVSVLTL